MEPQKGIDIADFATIFQSLTSGRRTGTLKVSTDVGALFFYFANGTIKYFAQPARDDVLLRAMLRSSKIDRVEYDRLLARHQRTGRSYSALFAAKRKINDADIAEALHFTVQEEICDLFSQPHLSCEFFEGEPFAEIFGSEKRRVQLSIMPEPVVMEAARRMDEIGILRETVPSMSDIYTTTGITEEQIEGPLPPEDAQLRNEVLDLIDGRRDLNEVAELVRMSKFDLLRTTTQLVGGRLVEALGPRSLLQLAEQYAIEGNIRKALRLYERAEELGESRVETRMHIARLYGALRDAKRAVAKYFAIADDALKSNDTDSAVAALRQAIHLDPENANIRQKIVTSMLQSDRYDEAINESIELANLLLKLKKIDSAVEVWKSFLDKYPTSTEAHRQLAELYKEQDNKTHALQILDNLAELYMARQRRDRAAEVYREVLNLDPKHTRVRLKLASVLRRLGNVAEAAREYEQFRTSTRVLRLSERPRSLLASWFGLRHPAVMASARLALGGPAIRAIMILSLALVLTGILTLVFSTMAGSGAPAISVRIGSALFGCLVILQVVILFGVLPPLSCCSVLYHPHEENVSVAAQIALHPRGAVSGKFIATLATWLILLLSTLPLAITAAVLGGVSGSVVGFNFYLLILLGAVTSAALTLVSANVPDRKFAIIDSYLVCTFMALIGMLFIGMLSDVSVGGDVGLQQAQVSLTDLPAFQSRTFSFAGTVLLMPVATVFVSGLMLMGAAARLMPERGYSSPTQKMFWFVTILLGTFIGLVWAATGEKASTLSQPPVAQLLLLMSVFISLAIGAILFSTESAGGSASDQERFRKLFMNSRWRALLGPGPVRGALFSLVACALVLLVIVLFLGLSESSAAVGQSGAGIIAAVYFAMLGHAALLVSLGLLLSTTQLTNRWRRIIPVIVLGITLAVIPAAITYLGLGLPHFIADLSPLVLAAAAFGNGLVAGGKSWSAGSIGWLRVILLYWLCVAAFGSIAFLRIRKAAHIGVKSIKTKGKSR
jgi:tetratricopeptide (TPR) repeat protein